MRYFFPILLLHLSHLIWATKRVKSNDSAISEDLECNLEKFEKACTILIGDLINFDPAQEEFYQQLKGIRGRLLIENVQDDLNEFFYNLELIENQSEEPAIAVKNTPNPPLFPNLNIILTKGEVAIDFHGKILNKEDFERFLDIADKKKVLMDCSFAEEDRNITDLTKLIGCSYFDHDLALINISKTVPKVEIREIKGCLSIVNMQLDKLDMFSPSIKIVNCLGESKIENSPKICNDPIANKLKAQGVDLSECEKPKELNNSGRLFVKKEPGSRDTKETNTNKPGIIAISVVISLLIGGIIISAFYYRRYQKKKEQKRREEGYSMDDDGITPPKFIAQPPVSSPVKPDIVEGSLYASVDDKLVLLAKTPKSEKSDE